MVAPVEREGNRFFKTAVALSFRVAVLDSGHPRVKVAYQVLAPELKVTRHSDEVGDQFTQRLASRTGYSKGLAEVDVQRSHIDPLLTLASLTPSRHTCYRRAAFGLAQRVGDLFVGRPLAFIGPLILRLLEDFRSSA